MSFMSIYKHICCWDDSFYGDKSCIVDQKSAENITGGRKTVWKASQQGGVTWALLDLYYSASMSKNIAIFCLWFSTYRFRKLAFRLWFLKDSHIMHRINVCKTEAMLVDFQLNWSLMVPTLSPVRALQWRQEGSKSTWALSWMTNWPWTQTHEIWEGWEVSTDRSLLKMFYSCLIEPLLTSAVKCWFGNLRLPKKKHNCELCIKQLGQIWIIFATYTRLEVHREPHVFQPDPHFIQCWPSPSRKRRTRTERARCNHYLTS